MNGLMILGPSRAGSRGEDFLQVRRALKSIAQEIGTNEVVIMEDEPDIDAESHFEKFRRVVREHNIQTFVILWPGSARLNGLDVEIGFLLNAMYEGRLDPRDIKILVEKRITKITSEGVLEFSEKGNRTRYYQDLVNAGCPILRWANDAQLGQCMGTVALEHVLLMRASDRRIYYGPESPPNAGDVHWVCGLCGRPSAVSFASRRRAHVDAMRHKSVLHKESDVYFMFIRPGAAVPQVPGPFRGGCGVCADFLAGEYADAQLADEAVELHRRQTHTGVKRVAIIAIPAWTVDAHPVESRMALVRQQASIEKDGGADFMDLGPKTIDLAPE